MQSVELQILEGVVSLGTIVLGAAGTYLTTKVKKLVDSHLSAKNAEVANNVIDGLTSIADAVVQKFNQTVVSDAKTNGVFTPQLAQSVKKDAIAAVMTQGSALIQLGQGVIGDVQQLVASLIEQSVVINKVPKA